MLPDPPSQMSLVFPGDSVRLAARFEPSFELVATCQPPLAHQGLLVLRLPQHVPVLSEQPPPLALAQLLVPLVAPELHWTTGEFAAGLA